MTCTSDVGVDEGETKKMGSRDNDDDEDANDMERIRGELCWEVQLELETFKILELNLVSKKSRENILFLVIILVSIFNLQILKGLYILLLGVFILLSVNIYK